MSTLKQIAAATGVHITTVAAVLNGAGGNTRVGEATQKRVRVAAKRLGYVRNESARRLRTGKSNTVGFIGGDLRNPFFSELASALERELELHRLQLVISHVSPTQGATFSQTVEILRQQTISKIIYWDESATHTKPKTGPRLQLFPIGFTIRPRPGIWLDLGHAVRLAVDHLVKQGHRRIGFYAPEDRRESPSVLVRQKMFLSECRKRGLPPPVCLAYEGESWNLDAAVAGARKHFEKAPTISAFVGFNDIASLGLLMATGTSSPKPLVVCFDGTPLTRSWPGSPPVLDLKISEIAHRAAAMAASAKSGTLTHGKEHWICPELID